ncbi:MAG: hypothetical protein Q4G66_13235 [bacterium]|nr:hypothetical protein [bacterium]
MTDTRSSLLTDCIACNKEVSRFAKRCPHCDHPNPGGEGEPEESLSSRSLTILERMMLAILGVALAGFCIWRFWPNPYSPF